MSSNAKDKLKNQSIKDYQKNGFLVVRNIVDKALLNIQSNSIRNCLSRFLGSDPKLADEENLWDSSHFHESLINFRSEDPDTFGSLYDTLQSSITLTQLVASEDLIQLCVELLGVTPFDLSSQGQELRLDVPFDKRNRQLWHQDQSYVPANYMCEAALSCWLPLNHHTPDMGPLEVIPGSHKLGDINARASKWTLDKLQPSLDLKNESLGNQYNITENVSTQGIDINELVKKKIAVDLCPGDVLLFHFCLLHQGGFNSSDRIRFTAGNRIHISTEEDFRPFRCVPIYNPHLDRVVQKKFEKRHSDYVEKPLR